MYGLSDSWTGMFITREGKDGSRVSMTPHEVSRVLKRLLSRKEVNNTHLLFHAEYAW